MLLILYLYLITRLFQSELRLYNRSKEILDRIRIQTMQAALDLERIKREQRKPKSNFTGPVIGIPEGGTDYPENVVAFAGGKIDPNHACSNHTFKRTNCDGTEQSYEDQLQQALEEENYLLAAKVRDIIEEKKKKL